MKKQITFGVSDTDLFFVSTEKYFSAAGFKKISQTDNQILFSKGGALGNLIAFNSLNWKSAVKITLHDAIAVTEFNINTVGQLVTPKEEGLWDTFIENYKLSITNGLDLTTENQLQIKGTRRDSLKYVKWALIGALVFGVPSGILAYISGIDTLAPMGATIGAVFLMTYKINQERKKNAF
jgi:hypothetical protein